MNIVLRRFIIMLLLVLQGFSPLVHAHVHIIDSNNSGIHIDEISRVWHSADHSLSLSSVDHTCAAIDMQTAIQQKKLLLAGELLNTIFVDAKLKFIDKRLVNKLIGFSPPIFIVKPAISLSVIAPRAPPIL
ncbi:MAG: hypothetical protein RQ733_07045 [Methyloprofundus sp.]|nr:hypothetical protein [Methyloprofundus sp.]MDT8425714.1 hypothetical protein [Methyloprofundus sp.]